MYITVLSECELEVLKIILASPTIIIPNNAKRLPNICFFVIGCFKNVIENKKVVMIVPPLNI